MADILMRHCFFYNIICTQLSLLLFQPVSTPDLPYLFLVSNLLSRSHLNVLNFPLLSVVSDPSQGSLKVNKRDVKSAQCRSCCGVSWIMIWLTLIQMTLSLNFCSIIGLLKQKYLLKDRKVLFVIFNPPRFEPTTGPGLLHHLSQHVSPAVHVRTSRSFLLPEHRPVPGRAEYDSK